MKIPKVIYSKFFIPDKFCKKESIAFIIQSVHKMEMKQSKGKNFKDC